MKKPLSVLFPLLLILACSTAAPSASLQPSRPRSIILLIADGAGVTHFTAARILRGEEFQTGRLPHTGLVATSPVADSIVADSAAAATAYAIGMTTNYAAVGVDAEGNPQKTVLQLARELGKATGLVTTTNFWDATPAAFAAHRLSRYDSDRIIGQMVASEVDLIIGGGADSFGVEGRPTLEELTAANGYTLARSVEEIERAAPGRLLAVFPTMPKEVDFAEARLPVLARHALDRVSRNRRGFFLLIEHEGTDGASHVNDTTAFIDSMISFDETVGVALDYASRHRDVLIVVTADHETGGLQIHRERGRELELRWSTTAHTGQAVPVFASGPGAERFVGFMDGAELGRRLQELLR